jgi:hypothetical protein
MHKDIDLPLIAVIVILSVLIIYTVIHLAGPSWDMSVRYLAGRTLLNFLTHKISLRSAFVGEFSNNLLYYFEPYREPLSMPIFAALSIFFQKPIFSYIVLMFAGYLFALYEFGKEFKIDRLIIFSVFLNSYALYFLFIPNGGEGLSIIFVLAGLVYLLRKKAVSGLFFGIASLAKYPSIILFPLVLLLGDKKKIRQAIALEFLMVLLWGGLDYIAYGVPFYSYFESMTSAGMISGPSAVSLMSLVEVVAYPAVFAAIGVAVLLLKKGRAGFRVDCTSKVLIAFIALAGLCYLAILPHNDPTTQARYGYLLATALLASSALVLSRAVKRAPPLKYLVALGAIIVLAYALYATYAVNNNPAVAYYNFDNHDGIYAHAGEALGSLNFSGCRFVSNAWVPMVYAGYDAYSPFILYTSAVITPIVEHLLAGNALNPTNGTINTIIGTVTPHNSTLSYAAYVKEEKEYPIVVFRYTGVPSSFIINLNESRLAYIDQNFSIYMPQNASCYKN